MHDILNTPSLPLIREPEDLEVVLVPDACEWSSRREALSGQFSTHVVSVVPHRELEGQVHASIIPQEQRSELASAADAPARSASTDEA